MSECRMQIQKKFDQSMNNQFMAAEISKMRRNKKIATYFKEFCEEIEVLGLKYVCRENTALFRRGLYLLSVLFGVAFAGYQVFSQIQIYLQWPVNIRTNISYVDITTFPKVVICNGNQVGAGI